MLDAAQAGMSLSSSLAAHTFSAFSCMIMSMASCSVRFITRRWSSSTHAWDGPKPTNTLVATLSPHGPDTN
jgi:hypothetical protein